MLYGCYIVGGWLYDINVVKKVIEKREYNCVELQKSEKVVVDWCNIVK